jgi:hypothetical protein
VQHILSICLRHAPFLLGLHITAKNQEKNIELVDMDVCGNNFVHMFPWFDHIYLGFDCLTGATVIRLLTLCPQLVSTFCLLSTYVALPTLSTFRWLTQNILISQDQGCFTYICMSEEEDKYRWTKCL